MRQIKELPNLKPSELRSIFKRSIYDCYLPENWNSRSKFMGYNLVYVQFLNVIMYENTTRQNVLFKGELLPFAPKSICITIENNYYVKDSKNFEYYDIVYRSDVQDYNFIENSYLHSDGEYYANPERLERSVFSYHSRTRQFLAGQAKYTIGLEVEKECDKTATLSCYNLHRDTKWIKESDASLNSSNGYELISPTYSINFDFLNLFKSNKDLADSINGGTTSNCGGHINIGVRGKKDYQILDSIAGYMPLIYSLYKNRMKNSFCQVKSIERLKSSNDKYQAIGMKGNYIEFRIFPAVKNVNQLLWRIGLCKIMIKNPLNNVLTVVQELTDKNSKLFKHMVKVFSVSQIFDKVNELINIYIEIENGTIPEDFYRNLELKRTEIINEV